MNKKKCDGLFLPAVDSMGIRLPITEIVERLLSKQEVRFVLVDAAQALGHTDLSEIAGVADFIVAGTAQMGRQLYPAWCGNRSQSEEPTVDRKFFESRNWNQ